MGIRLPVCCGFTLSNRALFPTWRCLTISSNSVARAAFALQELSKLSGPELEAAERRVKQRTLGNIRLIAELFNKEVVREPIVHACVGELLGDSARVEPVEDNIEVRPCVRGGGLDADRQHGHSTALGRMTALLAASRRFAVWQNETMACARV